MSEYEPKTKEEAQRAVNLFCNKCDLIRGYSLWSYKTISIKGRISVNEAESESSYEGPSSEQIDAVLLHIRFFINRNEGSHIGYLPKIISLIDVDADDRNRINEILNKKKHWSASLSGLEGLTNSELFNILIFGARIHANEKDHVDDYAEFMRFDLFRTAELFHLSSIVNSYMVFMWAIQAVLQKYKA